MFSARNIFRTLSVVAALALVAAPAMAGDPPRDDAPADHAINDKSFPMPSAQFQKIVDRRIEKARQHLEELMMKGNVPEAKRAEIRRAAEAGAARVRAAATRVEADGKVTKEEAREVRELAREVVKNLRQRYGHGHARGQSQGQGHGRGRRQ
ncbi:MAG: hypothetical protein HY898_16685 [Deltaproteobacteria bacterium]|nr:hypothetical protein [Deltaproteobacteria bacterium]